MKRTGFIVKHIKKTHFVYHRAERDLPVGVIGFRGGSVRR